jgi:hypothetical protein
MIELKRRRARRKKLAKLRRQYRQTKSLEQKAKILAKAARISPTAKLE